MAPIYLSGVGGFTLIIMLSLSSNWTELYWTGTELGNIISFTLKHPVAIGGLEKLCSNVHKTVD